MYRISKTQTVYAMDAANAPVLTVPSGSRIVFETCDCFEDQISDAAQEFGGVDWSRVNPATGPVFVQQAEVGDVLVVEIETITLAKRAVMVTMPKLGVMGAHLSAPIIRVIEVGDTEAVLPGNIRVPLNPMIGVIGTAPAGAGISCGTPGAHGGNMDCKIIAPGTTLYLPVNVPGALLAMGDLHAAMGDGEVSVCGMEIAGEVCVRVSVLKGRALPTPMAQTADAIYTIASALLLDDAANLAACNMVQFIHEATKAVVAGAMAQGADMTAASASTGSPVSPVSTVTTASATLPLSLDDAVNLLSVAGNLQICQVVDPLKTCRYQLPKTIAAQLGISL